MNELPVEKRLLETPDLKSSPEEKAEKIKKEMQRLALKEAEPFYYKLKPGERLAWLALLCIACRIHGFFFPYKTVCSVLNKDCSLKTAIVETIIAVCRFRAPLDSEDEETIKADYLKYKTTIDSKHIGHLDYGFLIYLFELNGTKDNTNPVSGLKYIFD